MIPSLPGVGAGGRDISREMYDTCGREFWTGYLTTLVCWIQD